MWKARYVLGGFVFRLRVIGGFGFSDTKLGLHYKNRVVRFFGLLGALVFFLILVQSQKKVVILYKSDKTQLSV